MGSPIETEEGLAVEAIAAGTPEGVDPSATSTVARSAMWAAGGQSVTFAATFVAAPFTIRLLGPAGYGVWSLLQSIMAYFGVADLGMATASTRFASQRHADRDDRGEAAVIWTALSITVALTALAALAASIAAPVIVTDILRVEGDLRADAVLALRLVSVAAVALAITSCVSTPQQVRMRWRSVTLATSGPRIVQIAIAPVVLAVTAGGVVVMAALLVVAFVCAVAVNLLVAVRLQPQLRRPRIARDELGSIARYGAALAVSGLAAIPLMTGERFFLAHFQSPSEVAYYAVAAALGTVLAVIPSAVSQPLLPALTGLASEGRLEERRRLYRQILTGLFLITSPAALLLLFVGAPFLGLWAGSAYESGSAGPFYLIVAGLWFNTLAYLPLSQMLAAGRTSTIAVVHVIELLPYLVLAGVLTAAFGAVGAAAAWSTRVVIDAAIFFFLVARRDGLPWVPTPARWLLSLLGLAGLGALLWGLSTVTSSLGARAAWSLVALGLYALVIVRVVLTASERQTFKMLVLDILPNRWVVGRAGSA